MGEGITSSKGKLSVINGMTVMEVGGHIDTMETVDLVFKQQRKLSFTYGAIFFAVTLAIPAGSVWAPRVVLHADLGRIHAKLPVRLVAVLRVPVGDGLDVFRSGRQARRQDQLHGRRGREEAQPWR